MKWLSLIVISGIYQDWVPADPECVALHLGADATYTVRQGGSKWSRPSSGNLGANRDFSELPKEICWLFNENLYMVCAYVLNGRPLGLTAQAMLPGFRLHPGRDLTHLSWYLSSEEALL